MYRDVGRDTDDNNMAYQKVENSRMGGKRSSTADPLGPNSEIGRKLKRYYDELISEEIPDRFNQLLRQLEQEEHSRIAATEE